MQDFILSDLGWMTLVGVGIVMLIITMWMFYSARGTRHIIKSGSSASYTVKVKDRFNKSPSFMIGFIGTIFIVSTLAMFSFYYQVANGPPYISSESGNVLFVTVVVVLIVSIFTFGMALLKNFGALSLWSKIVRAKERNK